LVLEVDCWVVVVESEPNKSAKGSIVVDVVGCVMGAIGASKSHKFVDSVWTVVCSGACVTVVVDGISQRSSPNREGCSGGWTAGTEGGGGGTEIVATTSAVGACVGTVCSVDVTFDGVDTTVDGVVTCWSGSVLAFSVVYCSKANSNSSLSVKTVRAAAR